MRARRRPRGQREHERHEHRGEASRPSASVRRCAEQRAERQAVDRTAHRGRPPGALVQVGVDALQVVAHRLHPAQRGRRLAGSHRQQPAEGARRRRCRREAVRGESRRTTAAAPTRSRARLVPSPSAVMRTRRGRSAISCRISAVSPSATSRPLTSTSTRGAIRSTSCSTCEETITVRPASPSAAAARPRARRCAGSSPFSGSSSSSTSGSCASACASFTRCRSPWENPPTLRSATSFRSTSVSARSAAAAGVGHPAQPGADRDHLARRQEGPGRAVVGHDAQAPVDVRASAGDRCRAPGRCRCWASRSRRRAGAPWTCPRRCGRAGR